MGEPEPRRFSHVPELDVLRGVAVVLVILSHLWILWPDWGLHTTFADGGFVGLDLFFVLSGFLVTVLALDEQARTGTISVVLFYRRRAARLLPALYVALLVHLLYAAATGFPPFGEAGPEWESVRATVLGYMNWHVAWAPFSVGDHSPLWSLAIELQFYAVWPFAVLLLFGIRRHPVVVVTGLIGLIVAVMAWRTAVYWDQGWLAAYVRSDTRADSLLIGALTAAAWYRRWTPSQLPRWLLVPAVALATWIVVVIDASEPFAHRIGITLFALAAALAVLVVVSDGRSALGPTGRGLALVGRFSYGIYLYHFAVFWAFQRWGATWADAVRVTAATAAIVTLVALSWILVERPAQRLRGASPTARGEPGRTGRAIGSPRRRSRAAGA